MCLRLNTLMMVLFASIVVALVTSSSALVTCAGRAAASTADLPLAPDVLGREIRPAPPAQGDGTPRHAPAGPAARPAAEIAEAEALAALAPGAAWPLDAREIGPREVVVEQTDRAYMLVAPRLMLGVTALRGGRVGAVFGDRLEYFDVGQRIDFRFEDRSCFLVLTESVRDRAHFVFGCLPAAAS